MHEDGEFDYGTLPTADVEYAILHIDGRMYPKNLANARAALEARKSGKSPEPPPILDRATDAKYTFWVQKALGALAAGYGWLGLINDQIVIIGPLTGRLVLLKGTAAWATSTSLVFFGTIAILAPGGRSLIEVVLPRVWWIYPLGILITLAVAGLARYVGGA